MRHLYLLRHGKSDWDSAAGQDFDRPLAPRGVEAARRVGAFLTALDQAPSTVVASAAARTTATAELAIEAGGWSAPLALDRSLYLASMPAMLARLRQVAARDKALLLVGHNPTCAELASALVGGARLRYPTGALARIDFDLDSWREVVPGGGVLEWYVVPRMLAAFERSIELPGRD